MDEYVITPGGMRHRSRVHQTKPGQTLDGSGGHHRILGAAGETVTDLGRIGSRPKGVTYPGQLGSGWITYASWTRPSAAITSFSTVWTVPPFPATQSGQLIYLFNGIQGNGILQPVLQWGNNGAFGGNYWCVASWYVTGVGTALHTSPTNVNVGDVLTGQITLTSQSGTNFSYTGSFQGIANTTQTITNVAELTFAAETLEAYNVTQCSDYPNTTKTTMGSISLQTGTQPTVTWQINNSVIDCGQHTIIATQGATGSGAVELWYRGGVPSASSAPGWGANIHPVLLNNQDLTAEFINTSVDNMRSISYLSADLTVNNSALMLPAPEISLPVVANAGYILNSCLFYDTSAAADFKVGVFYPAVYALISFWSSGVAITGATNPLNQTGIEGFGGAAVQASCGGVASGTVLAVRPAGYIVNGNASGTVSIRYAQDTPTAINSYLKQGSWISLTRVS